MTAQWPVPRPLEGVKSKKRVIFELCDAALPIGNKECVTRGIALTLGSRIAVVGSEARILADVLLEKQVLVSGSTNRHDQLLVAHVGSHLCDQEGIAAALEMRPQVIILSCFADDGENWAATFRDLLGGSELQSFQGAVVVCVADEGHIPNGLCTTRWVARDRWLQAEQVCVAVTMVEDICGKAADDTCLKSLQAQVSKLAEQCFEDAEEDSENDISAIAKQKGWTVAALVEKDSVECMASDHKLVGYVAYHEEAALGGLHLARVAVKPEYRKQGHASRIVSWTIDRSQKEGYEAVWSNAVPGLQNISTALGFAYVDPADEAKTGEDRCSAWMVLYNENQVNGMKECKGQCQASKGKTEKQRRRKLRR